MLFLFIVIWPMILLHLFTLPWPIILSHLLTVPWPMILHHLFTVPYTVPYKRLQYVLWGNSIYSKNFSRYWGKWKLGLMQICFTVNWKKQLDLHNFWKRLA